MATAAAPDYAGSQQKDRTYDVAERGHPAQPRKRRLGIGEVLRLWYLTRGSIQCRVEGWIKRKSNAKSEACGSVIGKMDARCEEVDCVRVYQAQRSGA